MPAILRDSVCNSLSTASPWLMRLERTGWTMYGCSHSTVLRAIRLQTSSRNKSGHSACRRMERVSLFCAATMILTWFSSKNPSREGAAALGADRVECGEDSLYVDFPLGVRSRTIAVAACRAYSNRAASEWRVVHQSIEPVQPDFVLLQ